MSVNTLTYGYNNLCHVSVNSIRSSTENNAPMHMVILDIAFALFLECCLTREVSLSVKFCIVLSYVNLNQSL